MKRIRFTWAAAILACLAVVPPAAQAQQYNLGDMPNPVTFSDASYSDIMGRLASLEAALAEEQKKSDGWKDVSQEKWSQKIGGRVHMDYWNALDQNADSFTRYGDLGDRFLVRRMRLSIEGEGWGVHGYKLELDWAGGDTTIKDVYWSIKDMPVLGKVQFGHFKVPIGLEVLTSSRYISFIERSMMGEAFYPEREFGAAAYNVTDGKRLGVAYGAFFHDVNETTDTTTTENMGVRVAGRLFYTPYYDEPSNGRWVLHTGIAGMYTDVMEGTGGIAGADALRFRSRPEARLSNDPRLIDSGSILGDSFSTLGFEAAAVLGSLSIQGELALNSANDTAGLDPEYIGGYVYASYFLTGEHRPYSLGKGVFDRVKPHTNFWFVDGCVGPGAWEVLARWSYLETSPSPVNDNEAGRQNNLTLGVNWYWNPNFRWMANYVHTWNTFDNFPAQTAESDFLGIRGSLDF